MNANAAAVQEGKQAWENRRFDACNPYALGTLRAQHWYNGWDNAKTMALYRWKLRKVL